MKNVLFELKLVVVFAAKNKEDIQHNSVVLIVYKIIYPLKCLDIWIFCLHHNSIAEEM